MTFFASAQQLSIKMPLARKLMRESRYLRLLQFLLLLAWGTEGLVVDAHGSTAEPEAVCRIKSLGGRILVQGDSPSWSPKGNSIVFCQGEDLKILDVETGHTSIIATPGRSPAWSPGDGHWIVFVRGPKEAEEVCVCKASGGAPQRLAAGSNPRWSPDGLKIYYLAKNLQYQAISLDERGTARSVAPPDKLINEIGLSSEVGNWLCKTSDDSLQIIDRKTARVVGEWPVFSRIVDPPTASPDGRYLAYAGFRCCRGSILGVLEIEKNCLLQVGDEHFESPQWSSDGSQLAFVVRMDAKSEIWTIGASALEQLPLFAPAIACPAIPKAAASLIGPWHSPQGSLVSLDLSRQANWYYKDTITEVADNDLVELPPGKRVLAGVGFRMDGRVIQLQGSRLPNMPISVAGIPVHRRAVRLYILHATQHGQATQGVADGALIAEYRVRYADGDLVTLPVVAGQDVRDWWCSDENPVTRGQVAWAGSNKAVRERNVYLRLYLSRWMNPHPEKVLESIDYVSMGRNAAPFCVAITAEEPRALGSVKGP
jgi:hypothetical protein